MITFESNIGKLDYLLGVNYIFIPASVLNECGGIKSGRWICHLQNQIKFQCGFVALTEGNAYITVNKARMKKLNLQTGDQVKVQLEKDESEYGLDMCEELYTLLQQDEEGLFRFNKLSPGMQRYIIFYVSQVKNPQLRLDRSLLLIGNLKQMPEGKETFKAMLGKA